MGWTAYWRHLSAIAAEGPGQIVADLSDRGWSAEVGEVVMSGFPGRLDVHAAAPALGDTDGGWRWSAAGLKAAALFYRRDHWVLDWSTEQRLETPDGPWDIEAPRMRASLVFDGSLGADQAPLLLRLSLDAPDFQAAQEGGVGEISADRLQLHGRAGAEVGDGGPWRYQALARAAGLKLQLSGGEAITLHRLELETSLFLDGPIRSRPVRAPVMSVVESLRVGALIGESQLKAEGNGVKVRVTATEATALLNRLAALKILSEAGLEKLRASVSSTDEMSVSLGLRGGALSLEGAPLLK
ncbi:MAG: DUF2125 domain-containing protein [Rhodobacteraceae bacterium]|nr:DUF2125 domain-containing protein [Paracoccaceae bacterium]